LRARAALEPAGMGELVDGTRSFTFPWQRWQPAWQSHPMGLRRYRIAREPIADRTYMTACTGVRRRRRDNGRFDPARRRRRHQR